ncbi:hypothetical protein [Scytonema sp. NUACC26]|uniref:hypothetical protein n=1 Tax=Scytonema sp. NUACC26 TaxID=3140176 RepID=UPI0034DB84D6
MDLTFLSTVGQTHSWLHYYILGGAGNDQLYGGDGNDALYGSTGSDYLSGGNVRSPDWCFSRIGYFGC